MATTVRVRADPVLTHCFATVSSRFADASIRPQLFGRAAQSHVCAAGLIRTTGQRVYVAILLQPQSFHVTDGELALGAGLATTLGLKGDENVVLRVLPAVRTATKVVCEPLTVDDSEVLEHNQLHIEATLLRSLRVVYKDMVAPIVVRDGVTINFRTLSVEPPTCTPCALLDEGTELHVATKTRESTLAAATGTQAPRPAVVRVTSARVDRSSSQARLVCSRKLLDENNWTEGLELGATDLSVVAEELWTSKNPVPAPSAQSPASAAPPPSGNVEISFNSPAVLRKSFRVVVVRGRTSEDSRAAQLENVPPSCASLIAAPSNVHLFPRIPDQVRRTGETALPLGDAASSFGPSFDEIREIHGTVVDDLVHAIGQRPRDTPESATLPNAVVAVCGEHGSGKSEIASAAAVRVGRHVVRVRCAPRLSDTVRALRRATLRAVLCQPSLIVLEDLDMCCPAPHEGHAQLATADLSNVVGIASLLRDWCRSPQVADVAFVATLRSRESVHAVFTTTSDPFTNFFKVAPMRLEQRTLLARRVFGTELSETDATAMAGKTENFVPFDFVQLRRRLDAQRRDEIPPGTTVGQRVLDILISYQPLSHASAGLQKKGGAPSSSSSAVTGWQRIGGLSEARKALHQSIVLPAKHPRLFESLPLKTRSGILLYGPPGCGKSYVVSALMEAENLNCIVVKGPEILDKYIGASEQKVRDVFERAQAASPCVVFFDEFDSVAPQRGHDNTGVTDRVVNQLLCYLDGVESRKNVYVVAASSRPDLIDAALLRPGRLDKAVLCGLPNREERVEILQAHCRNVTVAADVDVPTIADRTENWTSADLAGLVSTANLSAVQRALEHEVARAATKRTAQAQADNATISSGLEWADGVAPAGFDPASVAALLALADDQRSGKAVGATAAASVVADQDEHAANEARVTMNDLLEGMSRTRCSLSETERVRFDRIYDSFSGGGKKPVEPPGSRVTHR
jgi:AAA+ superfamily predicted ATPase